MRRFALAGALSGVLSGVAGAAFAAEAAAKEMSALEAEYRALLAPRVAGSFAAPPVIRAGRAEIRPAAGTKVYQLQALARPCGLLVDGPATLVYRVEEPHSVPLARRNVDGLRALAASEAGGVLTFTAALEHAAVWSRELATAAGEVAPEPRPLPEWLSGHLERQFGSNPARDMLLSAWNEDPGYAWAVFEAGGETLGFDVDPRPQAKTEALMRFEQVEIAARPYGGRRYPQELAAQPIARSWTDPVAFPYVVTAYDLSLVNDRDEHATTTAKVRITANDDLRLLPMALWSDVASGAKLSPYAIRRLSVNGSAASYVHHEDTLLVHLPQRFTRGQSFELEVEVEGAILERPEGDNYWILSYAPWYPLAHEGLTRASFHVALSTPSPFVPFASGAVSKRASENGVNTVETSLPGPAEAAVALAGKYNVVSETRNGYTVNVATYLEKREKEAKKLAGLYFPLKECYEFWLGTPYPFPELHVLEVNDWGWGQAPPGVIFITKEAFMTRARAGGEDSEEVAEATTRGFNERFAHEIAHGYFPHTAMTASAEDSWLSESFSDYASAVCVERAAADKADGRRRFERQLREWKRFDSETKEGVSIHLAEHLSGRKERDGLDRYRVLYGRGPLALHALRQELAAQAGAEAGEKQFFAFFRAYVMSFRGKTARTADLVALLDQITGKSWQPWFEKHIYGQEKPRVKG